jgi:pyruvate ferredoxin oxidoreductase beta subunit
MMLKEQTHVYVGGAGSCAGCGEGPPCGCCAPPPGRQVRRTVGHHRGHRLQHRLHLDLSLQSVPRSLDQLAVRKRPGRRHGGSHALGPDRLGRKAALVHRRRRGDVRHRLPVALADARHGNEHQGLRARYAGLFQHRRPGLDQHVHRPEHEDERARQGDRRQAGAPQGDRPDRHDAPRTFVAQTTCAHTNHFYRSVLDAMEFDGPALVCCYTTCQPEHGVADNMATDQARLAVDTRAFPLLIYDPRKGDTIRERCRCRATRR